METKEIIYTPTIAYLAILDKGNQPVLTRNYLCDHLIQLNDEPSLDIECIRMQMSMIAYSTLDIFDEKQKLAVKPLIQPETFKSFLGLL